MKPERSPQDWTEAQLRDRLIPALRELRGVGTLGDIVAKAGTPSEPTANVLRRMLDEFRGHLAVDENGELLYKFPPGLRVQRDWRKTLRAVAYAVFKVALKICIAVVLIAYFLIFVAIAIAVVVALLSGGSSSSSTSSRRSSGWSSCRHSDGLGDFFFWWWVFGDPDYRRRRDYGRWERRRGLSPYEVKAKEKGRPFYEGVFAYVFGEEEPPRDPWAEERELLAYIRDHRGRITATDLVMLTGKSLTEAEQLATSLMVNYNGDVEVTEDGSLIYTFDELMKSAYVRPRRAAPRLRAEVEAEAVTSRLGGA